MKKAKNLLLISIGIIFIGMIILYSCRSYTGPIPKIADTSSGGTDTSSGGADTSSGGADTGSGGGGMLDNDTPYIIPAITVTKDNILIAAVGSTSGGRMLIKTSKDGGTNWIKKASIDTPEVIMERFYWELPVRILALIKLFSINLRPVKTGVNYRNLKRNR